MSEDMIIDPYLNEPESSFCYRIIYSALGRWCLTLSYSEKGNGVSKHYQTIRLNELLEEYIKLSSVQDGFIDENTSFPVFLRNLYEELGFFKKNESYISLRNDGRIVDVGGTKLLIGYSPKSQSLGLGLIGETDNNAIYWKDYIGRDDIELNSFIDENYCIVRFSPREFDAEAFQFFNPIVNRAPSKSWEKELKIDRSIARKSELGPYYYVQRVDGEMLYSEELESQTNDSIDAFEYRRMYYGLRKYYNNPIRAVIKRLDDSYSELVMQAHLPNREYYLLLLLAWPKNNFNNKVIFIVRNKQLPAVKEILTNIGIEIH